MRRVAAAAMALILHTLAFYLWDFYSQLAVSVGRLLSHGNDVADIPRLALIGFLVLGVAAAAIAALLQRPSPSPPPANRK